MHDIGMNMGQLAMSVHQVDDAVELAADWSHTLLHQTEAFSMNRTSEKLEQALAHLRQAHEALIGYEDAIEADHNAVGTVKLV